MGGGGGGKRSRAGREYLSHLALPTECHTKAKYHLVQAA